MFIIGIPPMIAYISHQNFPFLVIPSVPSCIWQFIPPQPPSQYVSVSHTCSSSLVTCDGLFPHFWCYPKQWTWPSHQPRTMDWTSDLVDHIYNIDWGQNHSCICEINQTHLKRLLWLLTWINIFIGLQLLVSFHAYISLSHVPASAVN